MCSFVLKALMTAVRNGLVSTTDRPVVAQREQGMNADYFAAVMHGIKVLELLAKVFLQVSFLLILKS